VTPVGILIAVRDEHELKASLPIYVTVLAKVIEHGDDVHNEQHPEPPFVEHTTSSVSVSSVPLVSSVALVSSQVVVVGKASLPMDLMMLLSQPLIQVNGQSLKA